MALQLTKENKTLSLTKEIKSSRFLLGAGWDSKFDLDLSLIPVFTGNPDEKLITYFGNLQTVYAKHSGDNRTGDGDGDDENIAVDLSKVPSDINVLYVSLYCYSKGAFGDVEGEYFNLYNEKGELQIEIKLDSDTKSSDTTSLLPIKFTRNGSEWNVEHISRYDNVKNEDLGKVVELVNQLK